MNKTEIAKAFAITKLRLDRGNSLKSYIINPIRNLLTIALGGGLGWQVFVKEKDFGLLTIMTFVGILIIGADKFTDWLVGKFDQKKGFWKIEQEYNNTELNPFFKDMGNKVDEILKVVSLDKDKK